MQRKKERQDRTAYYTVMRHSLTVVVVVVVVLLKVQFLIDSAELPPMSLSSKESCG